MVNRRRCVRDARILVFWGVLASALVSPRASSQAPGGTKASRTSEVYAGLDHTGTPAGPALQPRLPPPSAQWTPGYDGRSRRLGAEEVLIWVPRALLFPAYLVLDYGVRAPLVELIATAEKHYVVERLVELATFADGDGVVYPTAFYDTGRGFWMAGNLTYKNAFVEGHRLDASAAYGTRSWYSFALSSLWTVFDNGRGQAGWSATLMRDPTLAFAGVGPGTDLDDQVFIAQRTGQVLGTLRLDYPELNQLRLDVGYRNGDLMPGRRPSIASARSIFDPDEVPGFGASYNLALAQLRLELDSRAADRRFSTGTGVRLDAAGSAQASVDGGALRFLRYSLQPTVYWDISGVNHVLAFSTFAEALSRLGGAAVPVTELPFLGGDDHLRGFLPGRLRGESALVHRVAYSWPLLFFLDGLLFTELGGAFDGFFRDFTYGHMLLDWGLGLRTALTRDYGVDLLLAFGSNALSRWEEDEGFRLESVRFTLGASRVF